MQSLETILNRTKLSTKFCKKVISNVRNKFIFDFKERNHHPLPDKLISTLKKVESALFKHHVLLLHREDSLTFKIILSTLQQIVITLWDSGSIRNILLENLFQEETASFTSVCLKRNHLFAIAENRSGLRTFQSKKLSVPLKDIRKASEVIMIHEEGVGEGGKGLNATEEWLLSWTSSKWKLWAVNRDENFIRLSEQPAGEGSLRQESRLLGADFLSSEEFYVIEELRNGEGLLLHFWRWSASVQKLVCDRSLPVRVSESIVTFAYNPSRNSFAFGGLLGTLWMFDCAQSSLVSSEVLHNSPISLLRWHPKGNVLAVGGVNIHFFDIAFNRIPFHWENEVFHPMEEMGLKSLGFESNVKESLWLSSPTTSVEFFICILLRGPILVIRVEGTTDLTDLTRLHLLHPDSSQILNLLGQLNRPEELYECFSLVVNNLLRSGEEGRDEFLKMLFRKFGKKLQQFPQTTHLHIRFFYLLLRLEYFVFVDKSGRKFEDAFRIASQLEKVELFQEILDAAHKEGEEIIAGLAHQRIVALDPFTPLREKEVKGVEDIQQYLTAILQAHENGETLNRTDQLRLSK